MLPAVTFDEMGNFLNVNHLLDTLENTSELSIFDTKIVKDFYEFQWKGYAMHIQYFGCVIHFAYILTFIVYVD